MEVTFAAMALPILKACSLLAPGKCTNKLSVSPYLPKIQTEENEGRGRMREGEEERREEEQDRREQKKSEERRAKKASVGERVGDWREGGKKI
jgi:hypothetical protein